MPDGKRAGMMGCAGCHHTRIGVQAVTPETRKLIRSVTLIFGLGLTSLFCLVFTLMQAALTNLESLLVVLGVCLLPSVILIVRKDGGQVTQPSLEFEER
jgi:hypothetical protein